MTGEKTTHRVRVHAAPRDVYDLAADATRWPVLFGPTVHVDLLAHDEAEERFSIWALANGTVANWTSRRTFDPVGLRISFRQERSAPPIAWMSGSWEFHEHNGETEVLLHHEFETVDRSSAARDLVMRALDTNSPAELDALRRMAELGAPIDELCFSFAETVEVADAKSAYEFVEQAAEWPRRLDHVRAMTLTEDPAGVQWMTMDTEGADGSAHTTESVRVCEPGRRIVYKQIQPPSVLLGHSGVWTFTDKGVGATVTSTHTALLDPRAVLDGSFARMREQVTAALRANSRRTMEAAGRFTGS